MTPNSWDKQAGQFGCNRVNSQTIIQFVPFRALFQQDFEKNTTLVSDFFSIDRE
jgi:hypothetical protein